MKHLHLLGQIFKDAAKVIEVKKKMPIEVDFSELHQVPWEGIKEFIQCIKESELYQISHLNLSHNYLNEEHF